MISPFRVEPLYRTALVLCASVVPIIWGIASCAPENAIENSENSSEYRIAALSPSVALLLQQLGLEEHIVGRHGFDTFLSAEIPIVGDQAGIDYEQLARVRPTHVLLEWGEREMPARLARLASNQGWEIEDFTLLGLDDLQDSLERLGMLFDAEEVSTLLVGRIEESLTPMADDALDGLSALPMYWTSPLGVAGPTSFHAQMLTRMGLALAVSEGPAYIEMEAEDLSRLDPGIVILFLPEASADTIEDSLARLDELFGAIDAGLYIVVDDPTSLSLSARIAEIASQIRGEILAMDPGT